MQISYQWGSFKCNITMVNGLLVLLEGCTLCGGEETKSKFLNFETEPLFFLDVISLLQVCIATAGKYNQCSHCVKLNHKVT